MAERKISAAPNYTTPALVMMGVNLAWILIALWAAFGLLAALLLALVVNHAITLLAHRRR